MDHQHKYDDGSEQEPLPLEGFQFAALDIDPAEQVEPEFLNDARTKLSQQLNAVKLRNRGRLAELERMGATLRPEVVLLNRLDQLLEMVLTPDSRIGFELGFESRMAETLQITVDEVRKARLLAPGGDGGPPPGLLLPN